VFEEGDFYIYAAPHWRVIDDCEMRCAVHSYDGARYGHLGQVKLGRARIDSIINEMSAMLAQPGFFAGAPIGINCASGFITFNGATPVIRLARPGSSPPAHAAGALVAGWYPVAREFAVAEAA
jgi:hypothetical protein